MTVSGAGLRESANTSLCDNKGVSIDAKISLNVRRRVVSPVCIAGVRISRPNFSAQCGRTKL